MLGNRDTGRYEARSDIYVNFKQVVSGCTGNQNELVSTW